VVAVTAALVLVVLAGALLAAAWINVKRRTTPNGAGRYRTPPPRRRRADAPHAQYHYPHARRRGRIYIGISNCPAVRHARHLVDPKDQHWVRRSTGEMVIDRWYPNERTARMAERAAIRQAYFNGEDPANYQHNPGRRRVGR
jgi:predicted GIY-YIG superfamily endonuclease